MLTCRIRKNQTALNPDEKKRFVEAVVELKRTGVYDRFVQIHVDAMAHATPSTVSPFTRNAAHRGPAFLPWHREFLRRFELELQLVDPTVTLPYWDWTVDNSPASSIWSNDFMGGNGRSGDERVMDGAFAFGTGDWNLNVVPTVNSPRYLQRRFGMGTPRGLPTQQEVTSSLAITRYDSSPWNTNSLNSFRNVLEGWSGPGLHNLVHRWVGGSMLPNTSPNDPIFFMHHCNVDRIWAMWQLTHPTQGYLPTGDGPDGHNINDSMFPWDITPNDMLDYKKLGYMYDTDPANLGHLQTVLAISTRGNMGSTSGRLIRINLFVKGANESLWERWWNGRRWRWIDHRKQVDGNPVLITRGDMGSTSGRIRINLFVKGADGSLWERYWNGRRWSWSNTGRTI